MRKYVKLFKFSWIMLGLEMIGTFCSTLVGLGLGRVGPLEGLPDRLSAYLICMPDKLSMSSSIQ